MSCAFKRLLESFANQFLIIYFDDIVGSVLFYSVYASMVFIFVNRFDTSKKR